MFAPFHADAGSFEIVDSEGFERPIVAHIATVPEGFQSKGRIAWSKPCSSNDMYETLFLTLSPDGKSGARIMPGYQYFYDIAQRAHGYPADPMQDMMLAQSQALNQSMATQFRGSNCAVGQLRGTQDILQSIVLPNRPSGARVLRSQPNQAELNMMQQNFGAGMQGVRISFDSQVVDLEYTVGQVDITERLYLSWYTFAQDPIDMGGIIVANSHTIVEPLRFAWTPSAQAQTNLPQLLDILNRIQTNPEWHRRIKKAREDANNRRNANRAQSDAERDRRHNEFIEMIRN